MTTYTKTAVVIVPEASITDANAFAISQGWGSTFPPANLFVSGDETQTPTHSGVQTAATVEGATAITNTAGVISGFYFISDRVLQGVGRNKKYVDILSQTNAAVPPEAIGSLWDYAKSLNILGLERVPGLPPT